MKFVHSFVHLLMCSLNHRIRYTVLEIQGRAQQTCLLFQSSEGDRKHGNQKTKCCEGSKQAVEIKKWESYYIINGVVRELPGGCEN